MAAPRNVASSSTSIAPLLSSDANDEVRLPARLLAPKVEQKTIKRPVVAIIGGGAAGLTAAQALIRAGVHPIVYEARARVGGRILTTRLGPDVDLPFSKLAYYGTPSRTNKVPVVEATADQLTDFGARTTELKAGESGKLEKSSPAKRSGKRPRKKPVRELSDEQLRNVDVGASIMHGCGDDIQFVLKRAIRDKIRAPIVAGGVGYESTEAAAWFDDDGGYVPTREIVEMHRVYALVIRHIGAEAYYCDDKPRNIRTSWDEGVKHIENHQGRPFTKRQRAVLAKIVSRGTSYCAPMDQMALQQAASNVNDRTVKFQFGVPFDPRDPPTSTELTNLTPRDIDAEARSWDKWFMPNEPPPTPVASMRGGSGDRIVLDGYTPFLIDKLAVGVDVKLRTIVKRITVVAPAGAGQIQNGGPWCEGYVKHQANAIVNQSSLKKPHVKIESADGTKFECDYAIVTLPLSVLQGKHETSAVEFTPSLSPQKQRAINGLGMGVHNKVILRFREEDVFWPGNVPQLNCFDPRFQFFNLHSYGKTGTLLVHVFAESGFAKGYGGLTDDQVVDEVVAVLHKVFCGTGKWMTRVPRKRNPRRRGRGRRGRCRNSAGRQRQDRELSAVGHETSSTPKRILLKQKVNIRPLSILTRSTARKKAESENGDSAPTSPAIAMEHSLSSRKRILDVPMSSGVKQSVPTAMGLNDISSPQESTRKPAASASVVSNKPNTNTTRKGAFSKARSQVLDEQVLDSSENPHPVRGVHHLKRLKTGDGLYTPVLVDHYTKASKAKLRRKKVPEHSQIQVKFLGLKARITEDVIDSSPGRKSIARDSTMIDTVQVTKNSIARSGTTPIRMAQCGLSKSLALFEEEILDGSQKVPKTPMRSNGEQIINGSSANAVAHFEEHVIDGSSMKLPVPIEEVQNHPKAKSPEVREANAEKLTRITSTDSEEVIDGSDFPSGAQGKPDKCSSDGVISKNSFTEEVLDASDVAPNLPISRGSRKGQGSTSDLKKGECASKSSDPGNRSDEKQQGSSMEDEGSEGEDPLFDICKEGDKNETSCRLPRPLHYLVTRWDSDPFSMGSYSYVPVGGTFSLIEEFRVPEKMGTDGPILFFAGEHASDLGWQCVHGAYETGLIAAQGVLTAAGLMSSGLKTQDLDGFDDVVSGEDKRRSKWKRQIKSRSVETGQLRELCKQYLHSAGHFYDIFDELLYQLHPEDVKGWELNGVSASYRKQLWNTMLRLALDGDKDIECFVKTRYHIACSEAATSGVRYPFHKRRNSKKRQAKFSPSRLAEHVHILRRLLDLTPLTSKYSLIVEFTRKVYSAVGAILPTSQVQSFVEDHLGKLGIDLADESDEEAAHRREAAKMINKIELSKISFPIAKFFYYTRDRTGAEGEEPKEQVDGDGENVDQKKTEPSVPLRLPIKGNNENVLLRNITEEKIAPVASINEPSVPMRIRLRPEDGIILSCRPPKNIWKQKN